MVTAVVEMLLQSDEVRQQKILLNGHGVVGYGEITFTVFAGV